MTRTWACDVSTGVASTGGGGGLSVVMCHKPGKLYWDRKFQFSQVALCEKHATPWLAEGRVFRSKAAMLKAIEASP